MFSKKPYIVKTRKNENLLNNLLKDNYPILFEGIHSTYYLSSDLLKNRFKIFRAHNIEHEYYNELANSEVNIFKKVYFNLEAKKLKNFEKNLINANLIFSISPNDTQYFKQKFKNVEYLSAFHPHNQQSSKVGKGDYVLFHGNLAVAENIKSVIYLINNVFNKIDFPIIIAGKNPHKSISKNIINSKNIKLVSNPDEKKMNTLISDAHISILHTFQATGIKLKLLSSLFSSRFCIANSEMINNTDLEELCSIKNSAQEIINEITKLFEQEFTNNDINKRKEILSKNFSNSENAQNILKHL